MKPIDEKFLVEAVTNKGFKIGVWVEFLVLVMYGKNIPYACQQALLNPKRTGTNIQVKTLRKLPVWLAVEVRPILDFVILVNEVPNMRRARSFVDRGSTRDVLHDAHRLVCVGRAEPVLE
uniref:Uncharacterized protein n=1 Tax=Cacopsylla melanoneura TaxID=428564 RepID=A0A8D8Y140_9HEMI